MAVNNIPLSFKLGGREWKVTFHETIDKGNSCAKWLDNKSEIQLARHVDEDDLIEPMDDYQIEHSFYHELAHVFQYYMEGKTTEQFAQTFATFMMEYNNTKINR